MNKSIYTKVAASIGIFSVLAFASAASFASTWQEHHPRRAQVNHRIEHQKNEIKKEVASGEMSKSEAKTLLKKERAIRLEQKAMAAQHNGHITKQEQILLNKQLNATKKEIKSN
jgi:biopolymer transport protein ExbB/TolQ